MGDATPYQMRHGAASRGGSARPHHKHQKDENTRRIVEIITKTSREKKAVFSQACDFLILFVVFGLWRVSPMVMREAARGPGFPDLEQVATLCAEPVFGSRTGFPRGTLSLFQQGCRLRSFC